MRSLRMDCRPSPRYCGDVTLPVGGPDRPPGSEPGDFWTGWWTFIGGPFLIVLGGYDLITSGGSLWGCVSSFALLIAGAVLWLEHWKIVWAHVQKSRRPDR